MEKYVMVEGFKMPMRYFECKSNHRNRVYSKIYSPFGQGANLVGCGDCGMNLFTDYGEVKFEDGVYTLYLKALDYPDKYGIDLKRIKKNLDFKAYDDKQYKDEEKVFEMFFRGEA